MGNLPACGREGEARGRREGIVYPFIVLMYDGREGRWEPLGEEIVPWLREVRTSTRAPMTPKNSCSDLTGAKGVTTEGGASGAALAARGAGLGDEGGGGGVGRGVWSRVGTWGGRRNEVVKGSSNDRSGYRVD